MYDYTRLPSVIALWLMAALFCGIGWGVDWKQPWSWLALIFRLVGIVFTSAALVTSWDWVGHHLAERTREMGNARVAAMVNMAQALKGLTPAQTEIVSLHDQVTIEMLANETGPLFMVRVPGGNAIPFEFVEEFLQLSQKTVPYLYPVREFGNERYATAITDLIVRYHKWAVPASGPFSAKLVRPLDWVASRFGVELDSD